MIPKRKCLYLMIFPTLCLMLLYLYSKNNALWSQFSIVRHDPPSYLDNQISHNASEHEQVVSISEATPDSSQEHGTEDKPSKDIPSQQNKREKSPAAPRDYLNEKVDINRTSTVYHDSEANDIPVHEIVSYSEGCERQFTEYMSLYPNAKHLDYIDAKYVVDGRSLMAKYQFIFHEPVIVGKETILPAVNTTHAMGLYVLQIQLDETISGNASRGGSAFRVISASNYHVLCGFSDLFNGTYFFFCPVYGTKTTVSVQLSAIEYQGYRGMTSALDKYIWDEAVTIQDTTELAAVEWMDSQLHMKFDSPHGVWAAGSTPIYHTNQGHQLPAQPLLHCNCIKRYQVVMLGASHVRNEYYALRYTCTGQGLLKHITATEIHYMEEVWEKLLAEWNKAKSASVTEYPPKERIFIVQSGSWHLEERDYRKAIFEELPTFMRNVSTLQEQGARVIVVGQPALPNQGHPPYRKVSRNNQITAVFNKHQAELAEQYNLTFIDTFSVTMPRYRWRPLELNKPTHHYLLVTGKGVVGLAAAQVLFEKLCPDLAGQYGLWRQAVRQGRADERARRTAMAKKWPGRGQ